MAQEDEDRRAWFRRDILPLEPDLLAYARQFCRDGETDPEDLVHETFARAIACKTWREIGNPGAFATRILRNCALDALRRRKVLTITAVADFERIEPIDDMRPAPTCRSNHVRSCGPWPRRSRSCRPVPPRLHVEKSL
jgi:RNA polymerase sigma factor (sigma-70 family)